MNKHPVIFTDSFHIFTIWAAADKVFIVFFPSPCLPLSLGVYTQHQYCLYESCAGVSVLRIAHTLPRVGAD